MTQQPLLTYDEVIKILETEMPMTDEEKELFREEVIYDIRAAECVATHPNKEFPLLEKCANFLRSKGIYVYFETGEEGYFCFAVGEFGRVYEKVLKCLIYNNRLRDFWRECREMLPIEDPPDFWDKTKDFLLQILDIKHDLETAFVGSKEQLAQACEEGWRLAAEIDAYLDNIKDLCRYFEALSQPLPEDEAIHYLDDYEIMKLLETELFDDDEEALKTFKCMPKNHNLGMINIQDADKEKPILERCVEFLRSKGLYVYYICVNLTKDGNYRHALLLVGKRGELAEKLDKYIRELGEIQHFVETHKKLLPPEVVAELERIEHYANKLEGAIHDNLFIVSRCSYTTAVKHWCEEVEKILGEVDDYLESIKYLQRMRALATAL
jgi:hypothetical protein